MNVFEQNVDGADQEEIEAAFVEVANDFEEPITIRYWSGITNTPNEFGGPRPATYKDVDSTAVLVELGIKTGLLAGGVLTAGDIHLQIRERLNESNETVGGSQAGDHLIFRGAEYRLIQRPEPVYIGDVLFYNTFLRRANLKSDQVGL